MYLFVYGTLMRGYGNNVLLSEARFLGVASVKGSLYGFGVPGFDPVPKGKGIVFGELYEVEEGPVLERIDALEGHPHHYIRERVSCTLHTGAKDEAEVYVYPRASKHGEFIPSGRYQDYRKPHHRQE